MKKIKENKKNLPNFSKISTNLKFIKKLKIIFDNQQVKKIFFNIVNEFLKD